MLARRTQDLSGIASSDQIAVIHDAILPEKHNKHKGRADARDPWGSETPIRARTTPRGSETRIRSRDGAVVLVDQPTEQIPPTNVARTDGDRVRRFGSWRGEAEGAMESPAVVVLDIRPERPIEMPSVEDERPVEALGPDRLDHALGVRAPSSIPSGSGQPRPAVRARLR